MFFILSKILSFFLSPVTWIIVLLVLSVIYFRRKFAKKLIIFALVFSCFFTNSFITDEFIRLWELPSITLDQVDTTIETGVLLGGGIFNYEPGNDKLIQKHNPDRFYQSMLLLKKRKIENIIISGGSGSLIFKNILEAELMKKALIDLGFQTSRIYVEKRSHNTYENAYFTRELMDENFSSKRVLLITSSLHMRRSVKCFQKQGIVVVPYPTDKMTGERRFDVGHLLLPDTANLLKWEKLLHEWIGYLVYDFVGYI